MYGSGTRAVPVMGAYVRASSTSAAVPDALSFAPGPVPASSRCAITTMVFSERPGLRATRFWKWTAPWPGTAAVKSSVCTVKPFGVSCAPNQRAAPAAPGLPGVRRGQ